MSAYSEIETEFKDIECLKEALADVGYTTVEVGEDLPLFGYRGDQRAETAHVVVRRQYVSSASNDLGFRRAADGTYAAVISDYDRGCVPMQKIRQRYAVRATTKLAVRRGYRVVEEQTDAGKVRLRLIGR